MEYRSVAHLTADVREGLHRVPRDVDLVVGIPRSGLLAATLVALWLDLPLTDVEGFAEGRLIAVGTTRRRGAHDLDVGAVRHALVVDDSVYQGRALRAARERLSAARPDTRTTYAAVYGVRRAPDADLVLQVVPHPRVFEWNLMHHPVLERACVDIDGVLCADPTAQENDDGPAYREFLATARPLARPTRKIASLVTSRLERYRPETEAWLAANGVDYRELVMLDLPDAATRRAQGAHGTFKAEVYRARDAELFVESECRQARQIAATSGKDVLCLEGHEMHRPGALSPAAVSERLGHARGLRRTWRRTRKRVGYKVHQLRQATARR